MVDLDSIVFQSATSLRQYLNGRGIDKDKEDAVYAYLQATAGFAQCMGLRDAAFINKMLMTYQARRYKLGCEHGAEAGGER